MEQDRSRAVRFEQERQHKGKKITRLVRKIAKIRGETFRYQTGSFAEGITVSGKRFRIPGLEISSWIMTTRGFRICLDAIVASERLEEVFEVRENGRAVFKSSILIQDIYDGGPLSLTPPKPTQDPILLAYKPGPWEKNLRRLAKNQNAQRVAG